MSYERCERCRFFRAWPEDEGTGDSGRCKRYPPVILGDMDETMQMFPEMDRQEWCGEFSEIRSDP